MIFIFCAACTCRKYHIVSLGSYGEARGHPKNKKKKKHQRKKKYADAIQIIAKNLGSRVRLHINKHKAAKTIAEYLLWRHSVVSLHILFFHEVIAHINEGHKVFNPLTKLLNQLEAGKVSLEQAQDKYDEIERLSAFTNVYFETKNTIIARR